jgi:hypothetical protein
MACTWDPSLLHRVARVAATEIAATGIHWTFSPVLCIRLAPQQFQDPADVVVGDRRQRAPLAETFGGLADSDPVVADRVRVAERIQERVRRGPDGQHLSGGQLHDDGHGFSLATDNGVASRTARGRRRRS